MMEGSLTRRGLLGVLAAAGLGGCGVLEGAPADGTPNGGTHSSPTPSTPGAGDPANADLHVLTDTLSHDEVEMWRNDIVPTFEREVDLTIAVEHEATSVDRARQLDSLLDERNPPELYFGTVRDVAEYVLRGQTEPVDGLVSDLVAANGDLLTDGASRGESPSTMVPHGLILGGVLNYRADVYERLDLQVPETWDDLLENARAMAENDRFDGDGFAVVPSGSYFLPWLYTAGGDVWQRAGDEQVDVGLDDAPVRAAFDFLEQLGQYSPEPAETDYGTVAQRWAAGRLGQCLFPNARLAHLTYERARSQGESTAVSLATRQAPAPVRDRGLDPPTRGQAIVHGTPRFSDANVSAAEQFCRFMYEGPADHAARINRSMRFLPPYEGIPDTDAYAESSLHRVEGGHFLTLQRRLVSEVAPHYLGERPRTTAAWYAMEPRWADDTSLDRLTRDVLVDDEPIGDALERARQQLRSRLEEGRTLQTD